MENMKKIAIIALLLVAAVFVYKKMSHHENNNVKVQNTQSAPGSVGWPFV